VISEPKKSLLELIESPVTAELVTEHDDPVADAEFILRVSSLPLWQQAHEVTAEYDTPTAPRSHFFAEYSAALLKSGSFQDTLELARAMEQNSEKALSPSARESLLYWLSHQSKPDSDAPENLLRVFVVLTARFFGIEAERRTTDLTRIQRAIIDNYAPQIRESQRAMAAMRAVQPAITKEARMRGIELAANARIAPELRAKIRQLLAIFTTE
jgi:hypothetical protein